MVKLYLTQKPVAKAEMLIRRPVKEVFEAFINPEVTNKFWFTKGSGRLEKGKQVTWMWEMYNISVQVNVIDVEENKRILIEWGTYGSDSTKVEWIFTPYKSTATFVSIINSGFVGDGDTLVNSALDSTGGFAFVLSGLKAWLEHGIKLNLVTDSHPKDLTKE